MGVGVKMLPTVLKEQLQQLYDELNRREFVHPDPLELLYKYDDVRDREIAALVASALAYGNVKQILRSAGSVLERMGPPRSFLMNASLSLLRKTFADFKHRFTTGEELTGFLYAIKLAVDKRGSLEACFCAGLKESDETVAAALSSFVNELCPAPEDRPASLLPAPEKGSACKRLNLFLRWMARRDLVDPGGWDHVSPSKLLAPVDTHMHRLAQRLGLTRRKQADLRTAHEITAAFRDLDPDDPVKFDFCLTRLGIRKDADVEEFMRRCGESKG
jgi:uncharacterized protein (TIGR02757 family)